MTNQTDSRKVLLASPEWIELAGRILAEVAKEHGQEGVAISSCQVFIDPPPEIANDDGCASWCYYIDGKNVRTHPGRSEDVDVYAEVTWELELAGARTVYTPELIAELEKNPIERPPDPNMVIRGDYGKNPAWMLEFHNRIAVHTA